MKFYGREKQRKDLHRLFSHEGMQLGLIYGRRRVGKSELIKQSLRETDVTSIYFECKQRITREWDFQNRPRSLQATGTGQGRGEECAISYQILIIA